MASKADNKEVNKAARADRPERVERPGSRVVSKEASLIKAARAARAASKADNREVSRVDNKADSKAGNKAVRAARAEAATAKQ